QYNGIKLCRAGAAPVGQESGLAQIKETVANGTIEKAEVSGSVTTRNVIEDFAAHVRGFVDVSGLKPLRVVADTANGMGGLVVPRVFAGLPFELEVLYGELDGTFPNHPADPIQIENLADLRARVLRTNADIGLAFDGDADRVFLVDDQGQPVSGSTTTAIVAKGILEAHPGEAVVYNVICSKAVPEIIRENGGTPIRSRVGHSFIKQVMAETGSTGSPSTAASGGSTYGRATPSRCCASTSRLPTPRRATPAPAKCSHSFVLDHRRNWMALDPKLLEILACPEDKGPLLYFEDE